MRKLFSLFVALLATTTLWAYDFQSGDLYYNITSDTTVEVTYQYEWSSDNYAGLKTATIPSTVTYNGTTYGVTSIGLAAFQNCFSLTSVTIPNSVTNIESSAFYPCYSLTSISIPNSVTSIGSWAFEGTGIYNEESNWENDVLYIDNCLIKARTSISGAYAIKENTRLIANYAFRDCSSLTSVTIPNSVTSIGYHAFYNCAFTKDNFINNSTLDAEKNNYWGARIGDKEIDGLLIKDDTILVACRPHLTSVTIPNSVTSIGRYAFYGCSSLISITIPNSVTSIGWNAFEGCSSLTSVSIPNSVTSIGNSAFNGCSSLTKTNYTGDIAGWCDIKFVGNLSNPIHYSHNFYINDVKIKDLVIPNSVDSIYDYAFYGCSSLTSVTIPNSVTSIGDYAFYNCTSIESIFCYSNTPPSIVQYRSPFSQYNATLYVPSSTPYKNHSIWGNFEKIVSMGNEMIFTHDGLYYKTISSKSIISLSLLTQENFNKFTPISLIGSQNWRYDSKYGAKMSGFQDNVTHQNEDWLISPAMDLSKYSSATLEFSHAFGPKASVPTTATQKAQYTCWISNDFNGDVTTATWTELPITYGTSAWSFITTTVDIPAENLKENCRIAWKYVCDDESATWEINSVDVTGAPIQQVEVISGPNKYSGDIVVPATVTMNDTVYNVVAIGTEAFYNCSSLTSLAIPTSIKRIGTNAIVGTSSLTAITLTAASTEEHCNGELNKLLRQLGYTIPRILQINDNKLSDIIIPETVSRISDYAFYNCSSLTSITIPNSIKSIGNHAFYECASLKDISIPNSVTTLGQSVFENCISLKSAYVGNGITSLDNSTFISCSSLESVTLGGRIVHIGESVFSGCTALNEITLPASVKSIGENAFASCTKLYDIYCFAMEPPTAYESSFANYNAFLHVPCDNQRVYLLDVIFGNFKYIECIEAETAPTDTVVVTPSFNDAEFIWPSNSSADSYTLAISKDGEVFCTLTFNANGQLTGIAFAPSRNGQHHTPAAAQLANGFAFTVTGLDEGANYTYDLLIQDRSGNTLQSYSGEFRTQSTNDRTVMVEYDAMQGKVIGAGTYLLGDTVTLTATPNEGYQFVTWGDGNTDNPRTLVVTQDTTLTALFEALTYDVMVTCDPIHGSVIGSGTYNHGDVATLTATPSEGYQFVTWGDGNTDNPRTLVVTQDTTLTALFEALTYNVMVTCDPIHGSVIGSGTYNHGDVATLTAIPNEGFRFVRWSNEVEDNPYTFVISDNVTLSAEFEAVIPSSLENTNSQSPMSHYQKIIRDGQLLILRDGKTYNVMGAEIQ